MKNTEIFKIKLSYVELREKIREFSKNAGQEELFKFKFKEVSKDLYGLLENSSFSKETIRTFAEDYGLHVKFHSVKSFTVAYLQKFKSISNKSYVSAGDVPWKMIINKEILKNGKLIPLHAQFYPTHTCNANCPWCSCKKDDREVVMPIEEIYELLEFFHERGLKTISITGGGEPTTHPHFEKILKKCFELRIQVGLVSNGILLSQKRFDPDLLNRITWSRLSIFNTEGNYDTLIPIKFMEHLHAVDNGISFVISKNANLTLAEKICNITKETSNITHTRFVTDILDPSTETRFNLFKSKLQNISKKVLWQNRAKYTHGSKLCRMPFVKPVIDANGNLFPCCGTQYAIKGKERANPSELNLGSWRTFDSLKIFSGSICDKCYYDVQNKALDTLTKQFAHKDFI